ncbi:MAG: hypothetical protein BGO29_14900 [Bacteroidales bacterium 36-12]|nr:MAG: hypothetical protein BGO29_14900 [Bacteroidales bacterium 36-12]
MKKEAYYFPHDCNARNDEKILAIRMRYGAEGYGVYFMIIERLRESSNYIHVKDYNTIAFDLRVSSGLIKSIIEDFGLFAFTDDGKCFYSESLLARMKPLDNLRTQRQEAGKKSAEKREEIKKNSDNLTAIQRPLTKKPTTVDKKTNKEDNIKVKKNKEENIKEEFERFRKFYPGTKGGLNVEFENFRKKNRDYQDVVFLLYPAIEKLLEWRKQKKGSGKFVPEFANLQTWINQRRWEVELESIEKNADIKLYAYNEVVRMIEKNEVSGFEEFEKKEIDGKIYRIKKSDILNF